MSVVATVEGVLDEPPEAMDFSLMFGAAASDVQQHPLRSPLRSSRPAPGPSIACALEGAHPVLLLKHGAPIPTVDFGDVAPKTTEKRILVLHNDSTRTQRVDLRPTSIDKRDALRVYPTSMELEPGGSREMEISWAPITAGAKMSKKFDFMWNGGSSALKVELRGVCAKSTSVAAKVAPAISTVATKKAGGASAQADAEAAAAQDAESVLIDFGTGSPAAPLGASVDPLADALAAAADARSMILGIVSPPPPPADVAAEAEAAFLGANLERFNALRGAPRAEDAEDAFESARESLRSSPRPEEVSRREDESMRDEYESAEEDDGDHARALAQVASAAFAASPPKPPPAAPLGVEADADADAPVEAASSGGADALGAYYDDNWREKRTTAYATWINFALTEQYLAPATDAAGAVAGDAAAGGAAMGGSSERQRMSLRELEAGLQQASLRAKMARLLRSPEVRTPLVRIEQQVQEDIIAVRPTLNLTADVGLRTHLLKLLDCYNPVWLRMGVEALIGETAPGGPADTAALRRFVDKRVLTAGKAAAPAWVAKEGTHFEEAAKKAAAHALGHQHRAIVRRVLALIWLLDHAKRARLLRADPCLFRPRLVVRSSRQLANEFSKHFLSGGIGDINRHLGTLGVKLLHEQTPLDEYDFTIAKGLGAELRDGVRLCKLVDLCTAQLVAAAAGEGGEGAVATAASEGGITALTLVPAENLSRKTHNARLALQRMAGCGLLAGLDGLEGDAARLGAELKARADLVVKGHTEATLDVLWGLISKGVMPRLAPTRSVQREVERAHKIAKRTHGAIVLPGAQYAAAADADARRPP
ncbi:abnormal spindle-like microcephaly-associated protein-like protein [Chrysochromulina tobinii]|uniref:Abnormal spindle-like microcephaly-associated protein-like protein n=1 Tax=Chrysochromulina tobinii TaxID=1460289 RepID=A0A0M0KBH0_9EUKA|nr:abnormal spindle-like microcephaly-associated protein-like protein [Chrysochromulina tobinii]|eukprot:KOO36129.1 abnormal spindle-like microcephaly-associated protein-like protein [Chrysochromulina sp. CCMP291]